MQKMRLLSSTWGTIIHSVFNRRFNAPGHGRDMMAGGKLLRNSDGPARKLAVTHRRIIRSRNDKRCHVCRSKPPSRVFIGHTPQLGRKVRYSALP